MQMPITGFVEAARAILLTPGSVHPAMAAGLGVIISELEALCVLSHVEARCLMTARTCLALANAIFDVCPIVAHINLALNLVMAAEGLFTAVKALLETLV